VGQKEFLAKLGFNENPFQFTNAHEEEQLQSYFVPPPYFDSVWGNPDSPQSHVIFAPRGGGKSAQRRMIEYKAQETGVFAITYDRFEQLETTDLEKLGIDYHLRNIIRLGLLGFLLEYQSRAFMPLSFSKAEREQVETLCHHYLGSIARLEALSALNSLRTLSSKAKQVLKEWAGPISSLISAVLPKMGSGQMRIDLGIPYHAERLDSPTKAHLEIVRDLIKSVGFRSLYILVDKVDETPVTGNNSDASFQLVKPLLRDLELLQMRGIGFKFFLWDTLQQHYRKYARPDRLQQFDLAWTEDEINQMLSRRLEAFSDGKVKSLAPLTEDRLANALGYIVVDFASGSPRDMIRVCQYILTEQLHR
jgi:hypothetical protein